MTAAMDIRNLTPQFCEDRLDYLREEKDGFITLRAATHLEVAELILNDTSYEIIKLCNGSRTVNEIVIEMQKIYDGISEEIIVKDVLAILQSLSKLQVVYWGMPNPFHNYFESNLGSDYTACLCCEDDTDKIQKFIEVVQGDRKNEFIAYKNPLLNSGDISEINIRQKIFNGMDFYFLLQQGEEVEGLLCIRKPFIHSNALSTVQIYFIKESNPLGIEFYRYASSLLLAVLPETITGFRFYRVNFEQQDDGKMDKLFMDLGAEQEFVLQDELGWGKDLKVYRCPVSKG